MTSKEPQNVDAVLSFRQLHRSRGCIVINLIKILIKCKLNFHVLCNPERHLGGAKKQHMAAEPQVANPLVRTWVCWIAICMNRLQVFQCMIIFSSAILV